MKRKEKREKSVLVKSNFEFLTVPINEKKAKQYLEKFTVGYYENKIFKKYELRDSIDKFKDLGNGAFFYFYFLKFWTIVFGLMSISAILACVFNYWGNGLKSKADENLLLSLTIGNAKINGNNFYNTGIPFLDNISNNNLEFLYEFLDFGYSFIFFVSVIIFHIKLGRFKKEINNYENSAHNLTWEVSGFEPQILDKEEVKDFFNKLNFEVKEVNFGYDFNHSLEILNKISSLKLKLIINETKLKNIDKNKKIYKKMSKTILKLKNELNNNYLKLLENNVNNKKEENLIEKNEDDPELVLDFDLDKLKVVKMFITFKNIEIKSNLLKTFKQQYLTFCCKKVDEKYWFKNKKLKFDFPDYPDNINWENLSYNSSNRLCRFLVLILFSLILFFLIFFLVFFLNILSRGNQKNQFNDITKCGIRQINLNQINNNNQIRICFCQQQSYLNLWNIPEINNECIDYLNYLITTSVITYTSGLLITFFLIILNFVIFKLIDFVKNHSLSTDLKYKIIYGTFIYFFGSFIIFILIFQNFNNVVITSYFNRFVQYFPIFQNYGISNNFKEPTRDWYLIVGLKILMALITSIILPISDLCIFKIKNFLNQRKKEVTIMNDYIEKYKPLEFNFEVSFSRLLNITLVALLISSGIPLAIIFLFIYFLLNFWIKKYIFIKNTFRPALYKFSVINIIRIFLPFFLLFHLLVSFFTYGTEDIFPVQNISSIDLINNIINFNISNSYFKSVTKYVYLLIWIILNIIYIILIFIVSFFKIRLNKFKFKIASIKKKDTSNKVKTNNSYNILMNFKYIKLLYLSKEN